MGCEVNRLRRPHPDEFRLGRIWTYMQSRSSEANLLRMIIEPSAFKLRPGQGAEVEPSKLADRSGGVVPGPRLDWKRSSRGSAKIGVGPDKKFRGARRGRGLGEEIAIGLSQRIIVPTQIRQDGYRFSRVRTKIRRASGWFSALEVR